MNQHVGYNQLWVPTQEQINHKIGIKIPPQDEILAEMGDTRVRGDSDGKTANCATFIVTTLTQLQPQDNLIIATLGSILDSQLS